MNNHLFYMSLSIFMMCLGIIGIVYNRGTVSKLQSLPFIVLGPCLILFNFINKSILNLTILLLATTMLTMFLLLFVTALLLLYKTGNDTKQFSSDGEKI